jgi:hypothetical protein
MMGGAITVFQGETSNIIKKKFSAKIFSQNVCVNNSDMVRAAERALRNISTEIFSIR